MLVVLDVRDIRRDTMRVTQSIFPRNSPTETRSPAVLVERRSDMETETRTVA